MSLFAGAGGSLLGDLILGHEPIIAVEWDKYCCQILRERASDGWFPDLQVWEGDVRLFNPSEYAGRVDCIDAGFPCQDISNAGKQAGLGEGTRSGLYREVLRIAGIVRPRYLFLENVSAILSNGFGTVLADLAEMGYDARWCCIRASDVGAPHGRDRWWCLATMGDSECSGFSGKSWWRTGKKFEDRYLQLETDELADSNHDGQLYRESQEQPAEGRLNALSNTSSSGEDVADTKSIYAQGRGDRQGERESWGGGWWSIEPDVGRISNGVASRMDRLKALGNGQVPLQKALAWRLLSD